MGDLSLKGVARRYRGLTDDLSVVNDICWAPAAGETISLRARLEALARAEYHHPVYDGWLTWRAAYEQIWTHIVVRVCLDFEAAIDEDRRNDYASYWASSIQGFWSNCWSCAREGELPCRLSFDVQWVGALGYHHLVTIYRGSLIATKYTWYLGADIEIPRHEFGHMIGLVDEYPRSWHLHGAVYTGTIMSGELTNPTLPARNMTSFADNIGSRVV